MIKAVVRFAWLWQWLLPPPRPRAADVPEPDGYRLEDYRAPTPATLRGARVIGTEEAAAIWRSHSAAFVDVLPTSATTAGSARGTIWRDKPRADIPGSIWLPDTGYGRLAPHGGLFHDGLKKATNGDRAQNLFYIAWRIVGCRGTRPSARCARLLECCVVSRRNRWLGRRRPSAARMPRQNRVQANRRKREIFAKSSFRLRVGVQVVLDRVCQIEQPLLDKDRHFTNICGRLPPVLENARLPRQLSGYLFCLRLIGVWCVLHFPHLLGFLANFLGHGFLLARKALDPAHHLVALRVERRIQRGQERLCLFLLFVVRSSQKLRYQFPGILNGGATSRQTRDQAYFFSGSTGTDLSIASIEGPVQTLAIEMPGTFNCWQGQSG